MKTLFLAALCSTLFLAACSKCTNCSISNGSSEKLCEDDFSSTSTYEAEVDLKKARGYTCTAE